MILTVVTVEEEEDGVGGGGGGEADLFLDRQGRPVRVLHEMHHGRNREKQKTRRTRAKTHRLNVTGIGEIVKIGGNNFF